MAGCPRALHGADEGVHDGVEALVAEDELLGERLRRVCSCSLLFGDISPTW